MAESAEQVQGVAVRLECLGLTVGGLFVPPFSLRASESICLHVGPSPIPWYDELLPLLTGKEAHPGLHLRGSVGYLERAMPQRRWWGRRYNPTARAWLNDYAKLDPVQTDDILARISLSPEMRIGLIGGDPRTMLSLEAALARAPDLLVFDTAGNSLPCIHAVFERLMSRPSGMSLAYLKLIHRPGEPCLPGAVCLDLSARTAPVTAVG